MINLQANIDERLWTAIENPYQSGNYSGAVVDSVHFISELIRDRTGLDGDGQELVGKALGGPNPLLKVNKLQTESERNVQKGIQLLLMGLYQGIRNPRSHGKHADSVEDADSIILFISFLLKIIDRAKSPFEKTAFLERVFDVDFVESDRYAELLVAQIPPNKHWDILIESYRLKERANGRKLACFMRALLLKLNPEEIDQFCAVISDELLATNSEPITRSILQIIPDEYWLKYPELARIRTEGRLIDDIRKGKDDVQNRQVLAGGFGTWARDLAAVFVLKERLLNTLLTKLDSGDWSEQEYVLRCFGSALSAIESKPSYRTVLVITKGLEAGDKRFYDFVGRFNEVIFGSQEWFKPFKQAYEEFSEKLNLTGVSDDDVPF
jgi:uncharacterized protein (TIGR02391 family)